MALSSAPARTSLFQRLHEARQEPPGSRRDPLAEEVRRRIHHQLIEELGPSLSDGRVSEEDLRRQVLDHLQLALARESAPLSSSARATMVQDLCDDVLGHGPIERFLLDPEVSEIMVNGPERIYVERGGRVHRTGATFIDEAHLRQLIERIVARVGRRVDESTPMVDARLPDGSRVNAIIPPLAVGGPFLTIRKFSKDPLTIEDLVRFGSLSLRVAQLLEACVKGRLNLIVSGGTGTGKTTALNVLSSFIPADERIVTIEDAKELQLVQDHVLPLEARPSNIEGKGEIRIRDLVRNALRMRPDRVIVGEVRGGEALDMLQAMNTGHDGSLATVHSNSPRDTLGRIETMTLMAGMDLPLRVIREQMASAIDLIVHLTRLRDGTRRVTHVTEVQGMEGEVIVLQDLFLFDFGMGVDERGRFLGHLKSTGLRPRFADHLADLGHRLSPELFTAEPFAHRRSAGR